MALPVVAVVGRPNVGKSTLFNKLIGQKLSIVEDTPGVTRDRIYAKCEWLTREFMLVDTGGIEPDSDDVILSQMRRQAELAINSADVTILVVDIKSGVTASDMDVAAMLQKSGKPVVLCVNKCDSVGEPPMEFYEFYNLGLGEPIAVSSVHGHGTGDLLDEVLKYLPEESEEDYGEDVVKVAIIGKPNVGKSSIVNRICGEERVIVSDIAGTTRDATDTYFENEQGKFVLIDTAGIRRKSKVLDSVEKYSVLRSYMAVDRADAAVVKIFSRPVKIPGGLFTLTQTGHSRRIVSIKNMSSLKYGHRFIEVNLCSLFIPSSMENGITQVRVCHRQFKGIAFAVSLHYFKSLFQTSYRLLIILLLHIHQGQIIIKARKIKGPGL